MAVKFKLDGNPEYGELTIVLDPNEKIWVEAGAMSRMASHMTVKARAMGGFFRSLGRMMFGGEKFFVGQYTHADGGWLTVSPNQPGSVIHRKLQGDEIYITRGAFVACTPDIQIRTKFGGARALFSGEGAFFLRCSGEGDLFFSTYGGVVEKEINGSLTVDTGHVVAWEPTLGYSITGMGGLKSTLFSGEGLVMNFQGQGKIWLQTRTLQGLGNWLTPFFLR